jgi:hypothetical protein
VKVTINTSRLLHFKKASCVFCEHIPTELFDDLLPGAGVIVPSKLIPSRLNLRAAHLTRILDVRCYTVLYKGTCYAIYNLKQAVDTDPDG